VSPDKEDFVYITNKTSHNAFLHDTVSRTLLEQANLAISIDKTAVTATE
jgi:hypothetical protein